MDDYAGDLGTAEDQVDYLRTHSRLPGPRGNLELMQAAADIGDEARFREWIALGAGTQPTDEFLAACGIVGLGRLLAEGRQDLVPELHEYASDPRWRVREAVAMALQRLGDADAGALMEHARLWAEDRPYVQRAAIAAVSEPRLLRTSEAGRSAVDIVDRVTTLLAQMEERRTDEFRVLRQALGYCWSVVVASSPTYGKTVMERWTGSADPDVRWILRENLKKARLARLDAAWAAALKDRVR
jgi:hypothetical protein